MLIETTAKNLASAISLAATTPSSVTHPPIRAIFVAEIDEGVLPVAYTTIISADDLAKDMLLCATTELEFFAHHIPLPHTAFAFHRIGRLSFTRKEWQAASIYMSQIYSDRAENSGYAEHYDCLAEADKFFSLLEPTLASNGEGQLAPALFLDINANLPLWGLSAMSLAHNLHSLCPNDLSLETVASVAEIVHQSWYSAVDREHNAATV